MPIPTIPLWGQLINNGINNIRDIWKTSKERYNSMTQEQKADAARVGDQWVTDNVLPVVTTVGELIPQTSIPMAAYAASEVKTPEEKFQHIMMPIMIGSVGKGTGAALKASEKVVEAAGRALKNADNYVTIQNALRTGKLKFGEPTTYTGIHQSKTPLTKVQFPFQRWDVTTHGADPNGFWLTLADSPNTTGTMASRPYASRWSVTSQKPLIQTGEVKGLLGKKNNTRNAIVKYGRKRGADAFEFRGIRDNAVPQTDVVMVTEGTNPQYLGGVGQVRYAGPTTGKSTFIKANPDSGLVDLDVVPGYKQLRKDIANQLGLDWKDPKITDSPEYQQAFNNFIRDWAQNTENAGKTLFGSAKGLLRGNNPLTGKPFIPNFETFVARNQARGFRENPEQLRAWYNSIVDSYPEIKIDNRFVGEMPLPYSAPKTSYKSILMEEPIMYKIEPLIKDTDYYNWKVNRQPEQVLNGASGSIGLSRKQFDKLPAQTKWQAIEKFFSTHTKTNGEPWYIKQGGILKAQSGSTIWNSGKYLIPVVGTYYSIKDAIKDPSWKNIGLAGLSAIGDVASIFGVGELAKAGVGAIKAGKTLKAMKPAIQAVEETSKIASKASHTYNKARQATNAVSLMNDLESPVSTVMKMSKKEDAAKSLFQAATKNADDAYNHWNNLQMLYNKQRVPINRDAVLAGTTGFVSTNAAQQAIKQN